MATVIGTQNERVFAIKRWLGLHESPDGDTKLKMGESAVSRNFRITQDGNLQKRPGNVAVFDSALGTIKAICTGILGNNDKEHIFALVDDDPANHLTSSLYDFWDDTAGDFDLTVIDSGLDLSGPVALMFIFNGNLYFNTDSSFYVYNGTTVKSIKPDYNNVYSDNIDPYIPLIEIALTPGGSGELLEQVNKLTRKRRVWLSPDGSATTFQLPEKDLLSIYSAKKTSDGTAVTIQSKSEANGTLTFSSAPAAGTNTIEVTYAVKLPVGATDPYITLVGEHYCEFYNGDQNNRIFLYGSSNKTYYSGINYDGQPDPTYFPDMNEIAVGDDSTDITALVRYNSRLLCFKENETYTIQSGQQMLDDGTLIPAFYLTPVHKSIGNVPLGQVQLVMNTPISLCGTDVYSWSGNKYGTMTADERQCTRVSDRVYKTLARFNFERCACFDDNYHRDYYISDYKTGNTLVWHYAIDAWSFYTNVSIRHPFEFHGKMYFASNYSKVDDEIVWDDWGNYGSLQTLDETVWRDYIGTEDSKTIPCYWESGSMDFGMAYQRKYSAMLWIGLHPQRRSEVYVTVKTDKITSLTEKLIGYGFINFNMADFNHWTFNTVHRPIIKRLKIKAKKFVYYKLIFKTDTDYSTVTMTTAEIRVRFTGYAK